MQMCMCIKQLLKTYLEHRDVTPVKGLFDASHTSIHRYLIPHKLYNSPHTVNKLVQRHTDLDVARTARLDFSAN